MIEILLLKTFRKRGVLIFTSEVFDTLLESKNSNQLMMLIGRQLGHIKAGHQKFWFFTNVIGRFTFWFYAAWRRSCNYTADRIGMLVAGDLEAARRGLLTVTVGKVLSEKTNIDGVREQDNILRESLFAWIIQLFQVYPYMVHRIIELEKFDKYVMEYYRFTNESGKVLGFFPPEVNSFHVNSMVIQNMSSSNFNFGKAEIHGSAIFGNHGSQVGDQTIINSSGNTIVDRSVIQNAFNKVKTEYDEETANALKLVEAEINKSENKEAAENFQSFSEELSKAEPKKSLLRTLWKGTVDALPTIAQLTNVVSNIVKLFA
jgi:hypothetical protein